MHGIEHCFQDCRALRLLAPRKPFSPAAGSMPQDTPQTFPERDRLLVKAFRSPPTIPTCAGASLARSRPVTSLLRLWFLLPVRPFGSTTLVRFAPGQGTFHASGPLQITPP